MIHIFSPFSRIRYSYRYLLGLVSWLLGWLLMLGLDSKLDLGNLSMILVLTSAIAAIWLPITGTLVLGLMSVMAFNWMFVPPRGTFTVDLHQHTVLLIVMFIVNMLIAMLMISLREYTRRAEQYLIANDILRKWSDDLRDADHPQTCTKNLQELLIQITGIPTSVMVLRESLPSENQINTVELIGDVDTEQLAGLWYCLRNKHALGPHTGYYQILSDYYVPLRGKTMAYGAVLIKTIDPLKEDMMWQTQSLCDQMGSALERYFIKQQQQLAEQAAHSHSLRTTFLAAISHDYRTPLATIMGAASSLVQQNAQINHEQQQLLAQRILEETERLREITNNILQLARLDTPEINIHCDWESAEELIGSLVQRNLKMTNQQRLSVLVEPKLPLLWCDSLLISQLLDNLLDNAFKYSFPNTPIQIQAQLLGNSISLSVTDKGPGIPSEQQNIIFAVFQQLPHPNKTRFSRLSSSTGVGIGLALCCAIANAHHGQLRLQSSPSGSCFECLLPIHPQPDTPIELAL